jgi:D-3-phosphoglycerate dehydrogenase
MTVEREDKQLRRYSIRGTVTESHLMVSRIDEFDRLYFEPNGTTLFFVYDDRPGVIATISRKLADAGINIEDMRNPHDPKTNRSLAIIKTNACVGDPLLSDIRKEIKAHAAVCTEV